jgi:DNA repair protein REV1
MIVSYGGGFQQYLDGKTTVTHIIASNLTPKKKVEFARYRIVKPAWVVDSVEAGKLLPWDAYRVVDEGIKQKVLSFDNGRVISQSSTQQTSYRDQTETSWYTSQIRKNTTELASSTALPESTEDEPERTTMYPGEQARELPASKSWGDGNTANDEPTSSTQRDLSFLADQIDTEDEIFDPENEGAIIDVQPLIHRTSDSTTEENITTGTAGSSLTKERQITSANDKYSGPVPPQQQLIEVENEVPASLRISDLAQSPENSAMFSPEKRTLTAEEHNAKLLSDPHLAKSSTANPDFLNQYYRESRLHHLSTWKSELKAQLQALANEQTSSQKVRQKRAPGARRYIMHVDFDSFFAAVSLRKHPDLVDKPVVIAHGSGPGSEIASCNYPARKFGVKNGMWMKYALQLCPDLKTLPYDYKAYEEASRHFYEAIIATDGIVQSVSIDEALVDVSSHCIAAGGTDGKIISEGSIYREQEKADEIGRDLRALIKEKTGCEVSVGIGSNILLAKVALRKAKPAGQHQITPEEVLDFVGELMVQDLPGVAYSLGGKLEEIGVKYVKDIRGLTKERLVTALGPKTGEKLWDYSRGIDKTEVGDQAIRKSVSAEVNWGIRFVTQQQADEFVQCLCDELSRRLLEQGVKGRYLTMKIMRRASDAPLDPPKNLGHGKCDTFNKSVVLGVATNDKVLLGKEALSILKGFGFSPGELRGLGVQMQKLEPIKPSGNLFTPNADSSQRRLQFKQPPSNSSQNVRIASPSGNSKSPAPSSMLKKPRRIQDHADPIERTPTPEENSGLEPIKGALPSKRTGTAESSYKLLNITGTQFVLPSQIDPSVLAELPPDIRSKLAPKEKRTIDIFARPQPSSPPRSRSQSPFLPGAEIPNQSQLDPDTLDALPEDVKNELLSFYQSEASKSNLRREQQLLSQSPRKPKLAVASKKINITPTKRNKPSTLLGRGRPPKTNIKSNTRSTLTQSNFVANPSNSKQSLPRTADSVTDQFATSRPELEAPPEEISESFLSALPPDLRREILDQHKRERLKQRSGLDISNSIRKRQLNNNTSDRLATTGQRKLLLPPKPEIPTFTSRKLSTIEELREAMSAWVEEFSSPASTITAEQTDPGEAPSGPYDEDVEALATYLSKVVTVENNMEKAVNVVRWIAWLVGELEERQRAVWSKVLERLKRVVDAAVMGRGLGRVDFG